MKSKFLLLLLCCIGTIMFPLRTHAASYSGYVGDEFTLTRPSVGILAVKIKDVTWSGQYSDGISCYETSAGLKVRITSYFDSPKTINCRVKYEWSNGQGTYTSDKTETYTISCKPVIINVSNPNITMKVGQTQYIRYTLSPTKGASLRFQSNNTSVATVDDLGEIKAVGKGYARITISQNMGDDATCTVTVTEPVPPTSISLPEKATVDVYSSITLSPTFKPSEANPTLTWKSSDTSIASVDQDGKVTGKKPGTTTVTVTTDNVEYDAINVAKFTLENDGSEDTAVKSVRGGSDTATGMMAYDGNVIRLSGFTPGSSVQLFAVNGQADGNYHIGLDGSLTISLDGLARGIHIVKTESITYKIIKK